MTRAPCKAFDSLLLLSLSLILLALMTGISAQSFAAGHPPLGPLPEVSAPEDNPITEPKIALGTLLFFDPRLSGSNWISCATCHNPGLGFSDGLPRALGHGMKELRRNTPSLYTTAYQETWFWDGRAKSLEEQVLLPIQNPEEMNQELGALLEELKVLPGYVKLFYDAFGDSGITAKNIARALASFLRYVVPGDSLFDRYMKGDVHAMSQAAIGGLRLFKGKANCIACHNGPNFTDEGFHNIGVPSHDHLPVDVGRYAVIPLPNLKGAFRTPTLRNIALTAPYMHNGIFATLEEVIRFYDQGGTVKENLDPLMKPLHLTQAETADLLEFLKALTGKEVRITLPLLPSRYEGSK